MPRLWSCTRRDETLRERRLIARTAATEGEQECGRVLICRRRVVDDADVGVLEDVLSVVVRSTGNGTSGMSLRFRSELANRLFRPGIEKPTTEISVSHSSARG